MEDFSRHFTVEVLGPKGWEVVITRNNIEDAIHCFRDEMAQSPIMAVRLTSPTDVSIYE